MKKAALEFSRFFLMRMFLCAMALHEFAELGHCLDCVELLGVHLESEGVLYEDNNVNNFKAADAHIIFQLRLGENGILINFQFINQEGFDF